MLRKKKQRIIILCVCIALFLAIATVGTIHTLSWWDRTYLMVNDDAVRRDVTELDLSAQSIPEVEVVAQLKLLQRLDLTKTGLTTEQFLQFSEAVPGCTILWDVPFQSGLLELTTESVTVERLTEEDVAQLMYLPALRTVDASGCFDYEALLLLKQQKPELEVIHTVKLSGKEYPLTVTQLTLTDADPEEVTAVLPHLTKLKEVTLEGTLPENEQIAKWKAKYPATTFIWNFEVCGIPATSLDTELYLNDIPMASTAEVERSLKYFYNLKWVEMCHCGLSSEAMDGLVQRHPDTRFIWVVKVGKAELRTDVKVFMPWKFGYRTSQFHDGLTAELKYCVDIECMDLGHMGVSDLSFLNYMPKMKYLIIAETKCQDFSFLANLTELVYLEMFITAIDDVSILTGLTKLEDLNLSYCYPDDYSPLAEMTWLKKLWLIGPSWRISRSQRNLLYDKLTNTQIQFAGKGSVYGDWRRSPNYYAMRDMLGMPYYSPDPE